MMGDPPEPPPSAIGSDTFDLAVDIRGVAGPKLAAIAAHRTQLPGGDPHALFPPGIVRELLAEERFTVVGSLPAAARAAFGALRKGNKRHDASVVCVPHPEVTPCTTFRRSSSSD